MTLPIGARVRLSPKSVYYNRQGRLDVNSGPQVVGVVIADCSSEDWSEGWLDMGWNVKVQWPYHAEDKFNLYNSEKELIPITPNKTFSDYM